MNIDLGQAIVRPTAALCAVTGGLLYGFSVLVIPGLRRLPAQRAASAMQQINISAPASVGLMVPLVGSAIGCVPAGVHAMRQPDATDRAVLLCGAAAGIAAFVVTAAYHVPRNVAFGRVDLGGGAIESAWTAYIDRWVVWNHVRAVLALAAAGLLAWGGR